MAGSNVSSVVNFFPSVNEGFVTTLQSTIAPGATTVPLATAAGLTNGSVFIGMIEPGGSNQQVFTGTVDTVGVQITSVVWTRGSNVSHINGVTIVDYTTGTAINMITAGILKHSNQNGHLNPVDIYDTNGNKILTFNPTASAVNRIQVDNAATGFNPAIEPIGTDTNLGLNFKTKGTDVGNGAGLQYNGVTFRALAKDWVRDWGCLTYTSTPSGTFSIVTGSGWTYPSSTPSTIQSGGTVTGDEIRYTFYLDAGTYSFKYWFGSKQSTAQIQIALITEQGTVMNQGSPVDTYVASGTTQTTVTDTGVSISIGGYYTLSLKATGKNASSTGYVVWYFGTQVWRTA